MDLNNKVTGDLYEASEWNEFKNEVQNMIISSGQSLAANSLQLQQAIARYSANAASYLDSGVINAYSLQAIGTNDSISSYIDGAVVRFKAGNTNTGSSTLAVSGLAVKPIKKDGFSADLVAGEIVTNRVYEAFYSLSDDAFEISEYKSSVAPEPEFVTTTSADLNTIETNSLFYATSSANSPVGSNGYIYTQAISTAFASQHYLVQTNGDEYIRVKNSSVWGPWVFQSPNPDDLIMDTWVTADIVADVPTIVDSANIASLTRSGNGTYPVVFSTAMANTGYVIGGMVGSEGSQERTACILDGSKTVNGFTLVVTGVSDGSLNDPSLIDLTISRRL